MAFEKQCLSDHMAFEAKTQPTIVKRLTIATTSDSSPNGMVMALLFCHNRSCCTDAIRQVTDDHAPDANKLLAAYESGMLIVWALPSTERVHQASLSFFF